jgi:putative transcriptional regulator
MSGTSLARQFLIAMPAMLDPHFARGVTFVCQHDDDGAMGLIVNRPLELRVRDVLEQMGISTERDDFANAPVYFGGPVQTDRGFVLHDGDGNDWDSSFTVDGQFAVTTSRDILIAMARGEGPRKALIALGYAGWSPGQLDREMLDNAWLTADASPALIFDTPVDMRWEAATRLVGIDPAQLSGASGHA